MLAASSWCSMAQPPVIIIIIQPRVSRPSSASSAAEEGLPQHGVLRCILYSQLTVAVGSPPQVAWRLLSLPPLVEEEADHLIIHKQSALDSPLLPQFPGRSSPPRPCTPGTTAGRSFSGEKEEGFLLLLAVFTLQLIKHTTHQPDAHGHHG